MKSMMWRTTLREIKGSFGRYMAILSIIALGVGFFAGLKVTKPTMVTIVDNYTKEQVFFDYRLLSGLGFEKESIEAFRELDGVQAAEGSVFTDVIYQNGEDGAKLVANLNSITEQVNQLKITAGRMPQAPDECVVDADTYSEEVIGTQIILAQENKEETMDMLAYDTYTVVGVAMSPTYMNFQRGSSSIGSGVVSCFIYVPVEAFTTDYYSEIYLKMDVDEPLYSKAYDDYIEARNDAVKEELRIQAEYRQQVVVAEAQAEIDEAQAELDKAAAEAWAELSEAKEELDNAQTEIDGALIELTEQEKQVRDGMEQLTDGIDQIDAALLQLQDGVAQAQGALMALPPGMEAQGLVLQQTLAGLMAQQIALEEQRAELVVQFATAQDGLSQILLGYEELEEAQQTLDEGLAEYEEGVAEYEAEIADGQAQIDEARAELADMADVDYYLLDRNTNIGYVCFESDSNIVEEVATVFPVFFFLVAVLVCMTTMNRMIEEQRTQIGVLKALGYSRRTIMAKYMVYSGSAAIIGCVVGFFAGTYVFPKVIWFTYGLMYTVSGDAYIFDLPLAIISLVVSLLCSVGTTWLSCRMELRSVAAELIRPKAPRSGKRILLERIPFIWNRIKFLYKVSIRNIFRYKKRFFMMVFGISGCTALVIAGLGLRDSIVDIVDEQYGKIQTYDISVTFKEPLSGEEQTEFLAGTDEVLETHLYHMTASVDVTHGGKTRAITMVIPQDGASVEGFLMLPHISGNGEILPYPGEGEAVISGNFARRMNIKTGDTISFRDDELHQLTVKVSGICENYVGDYLYLSADTYQAQTGHEPEYKALWCHVDEETDVHEAGTLIMENETVGSLSITQDMVDRVKSMLQSLNYIIALVIGCAAALAFIVLYNLTNINITERLREIATIKVLGFYPGETAAYVFRENLVLTGIGALVGLLLGKWLHAFIMRALDVDGFCFQVKVTSLSYLLAVLLTFVFAMIVNAFMYMKLQKIDMAESLKSIE